MKDRYGIKISETWDFYDLLFTPEGGQRQGEYYTFADESGGNNYPGHDRLIADGRRLLIPTIYGDTTHKLLDGSYTVIDDETMQQDAIALTPDELGSNLSIAKQNRCNFIDQALALAENEPIIHDTGVYPGGYEAAHRRNNGRELVLRSMALEWLPLDSKVEFYDINGSGIDLSMDDANEVILLTALKFQSDINICQARKVSINNAITLAEVESIIW